MALEENRAKAQTYLDKIKVINDNFNSSTTIGKNQVDKSGKTLGYWENNSKFVNTNGDDVLVSQYTKNVRDLGFTFLAGSYKALTPAEYAKVRGGMTGSNTNSPLTTKEIDEVIKNCPTCDDFGYLKKSTAQTNNNISKKSFFTPPNILIGVAGIAAIYGLLKLTKVI